MDILKGEGTRVGDVAILASLHLLQYELINLQLLGFLLKCQTTLPHHVEVKVVLPGSDPATSECVFDGFRVERFGGIFPDPLDTLEDLIGWQANKPLDATVAYCSLAVIKAILNYAKLYDRIVAAKASFGLVCFVHFEQRPLKLRLVPSPCDRALDDLASELEFGHLRTRTTTSPPSKPFTYI